MCTYIAISDGKLFEFSCYLLTTRIEVNYLNYRTNTKNTFDSVERWVEKEVKSEKDENRYESEKLI